jgi:glycosyltransferase involved in cell wall biosynthesis
MNPKIVMTLMVRDEADVIAAMIEHHLAQGVDLIIATDNGSIDGTREILERYAGTGRVEVHDYLTKDKNQTGVVSAMASRAAVEHHADWVINADADEFFVARDPALTLRAALSAIPQELGYFSVPVFNLTGAPARSGAGIRRLLWQDRRDEATLMERYALHAHPTADVIHVGRAGVTVQQGNHGVDIPSTGQPDPSLMIEVLHFPWRSYAQYSSKIENTGRSYDSNPTLNPSPRHHGLRDYRFWKAGLLEQMYVMRHPQAKPGGEFVLDTRVRDTLQALRESGNALHPDLLASVLDDDSEGDYTPEEFERAHATARIVIPLELEHIAASSRWRDLYRAEARGRREAEAALATARRMGPTPPRRTVRAQLGRVKRFALRVGRRVKRGLAG